MALRVDAPGVRYAYWRATLAVCLLLPWVQSRRVPAPVSGSIPTVEVASVATAAGLPVATPAAINGTELLLIGLAAGMVGRLLWLAVGLIRLRRLRRAGERVPAGDHAALQNRLGTGADVRYVTGLAQPVTFGLWRPVVLLPTALDAQPGEIREAVLTHELLHVARRDWGWVLAEEAARAVFWFHPAMWWLISRVQLAREEVVDALAVAHTGRRKAYLEALMAFADGPPLAPAPAFARRRHLFRRMVLISKEHVMTSRRLVASTAAMVIAIAAGGWYAVGAFPLVAPGAEQVLRQDVGPLERAANPIGPDNPVPRRLHHVPAEYPPEAAAANAWVQITLRLVIDAGGTVAEARLVGLSLKTPDLTLTFQRRAGGPESGSGKLHDAPTSRSRPATIGRDRAADHRRSRQRRGRGRAAVALRVARAPAGCARRGVLLCAGHHGLRYACRLAASTSAATTTCAAIVVTDAVGAGWRRTSRSTTTTAAAPSSRPDEPCRHRDSRRRQHQAAAQAEGRPARVSRRRPGGWHPRRRDHGASRRTEAGRSARRG